MVRSEGLEPPRFYSLPPQGSASTNSATSAFGDAGLRLEGQPDQRRRSNKSIRGVQASKGPEFHKLGRKVPAPAPGSAFSPGRYRVPRPLPRARDTWQHLLDLDRDPVAVDQHDAGGDRQIIGQNLDLVGLGCVQLDDGAAGKT